MPQGSPAAVGIANAYAQKRDHDFHVRFPNFCGATSRCMDDKGAAIRNHNTNDDDPLV